MTLGLSSTYAHAYACAVGSRHIDFHHIPRSGRVLTSLVAYVDNFLSSMVFTVALEATASARRKSLSSDEGGGARMQTRRHTATIAATASADGVLARTTLATSFRTSEP